MSIVSCSCLGPSPSVPRQTQLYPRLDDGAPYYMNVGSRQTSRAPVSTSAGHSTSTTSSSTSQSTSTTSSSSNVNEAGYVTTSRPYYNTSTPVGGRSTSPMNQLNDVPNTSQQRGGGVSAKQRPRSDIYPNTRTTGANGGATGWTGGTTGATGSARGATGGGTGATGGATGSVADSVSFVLQFESDFKSMFVPHC